MAGAGGATNLGSYITKKILEKEKKKQLIQLGREEVQVCKDLDRELKILGKIPGSPLWKVGLTGLWKLFTPTTKTASVLTASVSLASSSKGVLQAANAVDDVAALAAKTAGTAVQALSLIHI